MLTVHVSPFAKSLAGSSVYVVGPPLTTAACAPLVEHEIANALAVTLTCSLKLTVMLLDTGTAVAPLAGVVVVTDGGASPLQKWTGDPVFLGAAAAAEKSAALLSVSVQPSDARNTAFVALGAGAGPVPSKKFAVPYPTRSTISASAAALHGAEPPLQPSEVVELTSATLPAPCAMLIGAAPAGRSAAGSAAPFAPLAS